jgi:hypothetical protein
MKQILICLSLIAAFVAAAGAVAGMPRPYLALFTFQQGDWDKVTVEQMRLLKASPYDGIATWLRGAYDEGPPPKLDELGPKIRQWREVARKDAWPFVFLNRIVQQEPGASVHASLKANIAFARIAALDLDNDAGALGALLLNWQRALEVARALHSPGVGLDAEFYNNYRLQDVATLATRRGESEDVTRRKLRAVGRRLADLVAIHYPGAVIWMLFSGLNLGGTWIGSVPECTTSPGCISEGLLRQAAEGKIRMTVVDGSEDAIGYESRSLGELQAKLQRQQADARHWTRTYPQLELGVAIAPWLDLSHRAPWMTQPPSANNIEDFVPFFALLLGERPFVWIYGADTAYDVWKEPYASRFGAALRQSRERVRK